MNVGSRTLLLASAALTYGTLAQGGFYGPQAITLLVLLFAATFADGVRPVREAWAVVPAIARVGIVFTVVVMFAAFLATPSAMATVPIATHSIAILGALLGVRLVQRGETDAILRVLSLLGVAVAVLGIAGVALHRAPLALEAQGHWRAASTLTYANAMAAMLVPAIAASITRLRRGAPTASIEIALIIGGAIGTLSRGSALGLFVGLLVLAASPGRRILQGTTRGGLGGLVVGAGLMPSIFGTARPLLVFGATAIGVMIAASRLDVPTFLRRWPVVVALAAATVGSAVLVAPSTATNIVERTTNEDRFQIWEATIATAEGLPLFGQGLGRFEVYEVRYGRLLRIRYAHNEILQALIETGWPGAIALGLGSVLGFLGLLHRRGDDERWWLAFVVVLSFGLHGLTDFVWHVPAVAFATAVWFAIGVSPRNDPAEVTGPEASSSVRS